MALHSDITGGARAVATDSIRLGVQNGLSRHFFDIWCTSERNSCVIPGCVSPLVSSLCKLYSARAAQWPIAQSSVVCLLSESLYASEIERECKDAARVLVQISVELAAMRP